MRSTIVFKLFVAAAIILCLGIIGQILLLSFHSDRIDATLGDATAKLSHELVEQNGLVFRQMEAALLDNAEKSLNHQAERQISAIAIYAASAIHSGEHRDFGRVCASIIQGGDIVAIHVLDGDGKYFSGAAQTTHPLVVSLVPTAGDLRVDNLAEKLLAAGNSYLSEFRAPVLNARGETVGDVRLIMTDASLQDIKTQLTQAAESMNQTMEDIFRSQMAETNDRMRASWKTFRWNLWLEGLIGLGLAGGALYGIARRVGRPLRHAVKLADSIRSGNFQARIVENDARTDTGEVGALVGALNDMAEKVEERQAETKEALSSLASVLTQVAMATGEITASASHLASSSLEVAEDASRQETLLYFIAKSVDGLDEGVNRCARNAAEASTLSIHARESAVKGDKEMERMTKAVKELADSHTRVASAMKMIDDIAFQTNLLALNAAVEAARAGRHGKGFSVVAGEVRNLAARSSRSAAETQQLLNESQERLAYTADCLVCTGEALREIEDGVDAVTSLMSEIASISRENAQGLAQVKTNVGEISEVAGRNHVSAASASATAEQLLAMAAGLKDMLGRPDGGGTPKAQAIRNLLQKVSDLDGYGEEADEVVENGG